MQLNTIFVKYIFNGSRHYRMGKVINISPGTKDNNIWLQRADCKRDRHILKLLTTPHLS